MKKKLTKNQQKELSKWQEYRLNKKLEKYFKDLAKGKDDRSNYDF